MTIKEYVALERKLYDFNKSTLAKMRMNGELPYYKFGGKLFYKAVEVNRIIERNQVG